MTAQQLTTTTNHFESLFNQLNDPTVEFKLEDDEPIIVQANAAFREVFCADESVTGLPLNELIVPDDQRDEAKTFDQRTADGKPNRAVIERMTSNGPRKFLYRGVPTGRSMDLQSTVILLISSVGNDTSMSFSVSSVTTYATT